jgi:ubiquinone/menaquinone biosynthesis C-methylase UbiE
MIHTGFDGWAASYDRSQLQAVLYGPVHDAALRYARQHVPDPGTILDVGCGTGRLPARLAAAYPQAHVVGVDASTAMIRNAVTAPAHHQARFAVCIAEQLPFADAVFDLAVATLSVSHWSDQVAGLAGLSRVMAPGAILVAAGVRAARSVPAALGWTQRRRSWRPGELPALICAGGLRVEHIEPVRSVAGLADAVLVAATKPRRRRTVQFSICPGQ